MIGARFSALALAVSVCATAFGSDANERKFIREGMGEGEVLFKIGKPDHEAFIRIVKGEPEEKIWSCFSSSPRPADFDYRDLSRRRGDQGGTQDCEVTGTRAAVPPWPQSTAGLRQPAVGSVGR